MLLAVSIHASPIVFCVGTDMISSGLKKIKIIIYMIILSINTPIGILIGILVTVHKEEASGQHILIIGVLQGLAAGTLLYITFFEVLSRDKLGKYGMSGLVGALAVILGFSLMAALEVSGGHSHGGHGHAHHHARTHQDQRIQIIPELEYKNHESGHEEYADHELNFERFDEHIYDHDYIEDDQNHNHKEYNFHKLEEHIHDQSEKEHNHGYKEHNHLNEHHEENSHEHSGSEEEHNHDPEDKKHNQRKLYEDKDHETFTSKFDDYFEYNITNSEFMHDNIAYE